MASVAVKSNPITELVFVKLAREIAMEIRDLPDILKSHNVDDAQWETIKANARFRQFLESEVLTWHSALNTHERVKVKAASLIEEWLPELNTRIHDKDESLASKIEGGKFAARLAGMGVTGANIDGASGERFTINISLGGDANLKFEKEVTPKVIEGEAVDI